MGCQVGQGGPQARGHSSWVSSVAFSLDGSRIASGSYDDTIRIWDARSGKEVRTVPMGLTVDRLRFERSSDFGLQLQTNAGSIDLDVEIQSDDQLPLDQQSASNGMRLAWNLSGDGSWVTWCGRGQYGSHLISDLDNQTFRKMGQQLPSAVRRDAWWL
ncbi:hypothetical protein B0I35DRAFT_501632 [Stachybotrys elegans]|uniref:Mitochondrial division protein 1 n=1 Tax=Stachybotrys elegans TaxID=80388 RepID=A0A8K0SCE5_9HYPO|nr:hypothetical protein B0I35DRAFT_501632 [Stachybotrys elegans]